MNRFSIAALFLVSLMPNAWSAPPNGPVFTCQNSVCVFNPSATDSDGDGFSDADEVLAGTNPYNAKSRPPVLNLIKIWKKGKPGLKGNPFREIIVLPETAPNGKAIGRAPIPDMPGRKDALAALGLNNVFLGKRDLSNGLRVAMNISTPAKQMPATMRVGGIDIRLIEADGGSGSSGVVPVHHSEEGGEVTEWFDKETGEKVGQDSTVHHPNGCTTHQTCDKTSCSTATTCEPGVSMVNPDADPSFPPTGGGVIVATPEQITAYNKKRGTNTNFGPRITVDTSGPPPVKNQAPIILVNPDDDSVWISTQPTTGVPTNFNRFGGNVNTGRPDGPPRPPR